jgi:hypothetical protein
MLRSRFEESIKSSLDNLYRMNMNLRDIVSKQEERIRLLENILKEKEKEKEDQEKEVEKI